MVRRKNRSDCQFDVCVSNGKKATHDTTWSLVAPDSKEVASSCFTQVRNLSPVSAGVYFGGDRQKARLSCRRTLRNRGPYAQPRANE